MVNWDSETELKLCIAVINQCEAKPDWAEIEKVMNNTMGGGFSKEGIRQHYQKKILIKAKEGNDGTTTPRKTAKGNKTEAADSEGPSKPPKTKATTTKGTPRKRKAAAQADDAEKPKKQAKLTKAKQQEEKAEQEEKEVKSEVKEEEREESPLET